MNRQDCSLCGQPAEYLSRQNTNDPADLFEDHWNCQTCGRFRIRSRVALDLQHNPELASHRFLLSAYTKEGRNVLIDADLVDRLGTGGLRERTVPEKLELILRWFAGKSPEFGHEVVHEPWRDYPLGWCGSKDEWSRLVGLLAKEREHLRPAASASVCSVTLKGWEWLGTRPIEAASTAFVAMNFDEKYQDLRRAIEQAIGKAGYTPVVVSQDVYTGGVMDRVLARIREARFVVVDYTGNRGGVYYEAGFALGLGKLAIHSCMQEQLDSADKKDTLHFDVRHLKILPWKTDQLPKYAEDLENHIVALLGRGPVEPTPSRGRP
jgi:hypothetical protein